MTKAPVIQRAFNAGYMLEKHQPKLAAQIAKGLQDPKTEFAQGFSAGRKQLAVERGLSKSNFLEKLKAAQGTKSPSQSKGKDKGFDIEI